MIISGPCSAETEEQVVQTAQRLAATGWVDVLRAGIWKPRTKPGGFEGIGAKGLPWMQQAKKLTGLPVTVEVATGKQVQDALTFDVDILWIGARTTVNPFSVQEVADAVVQAKLAQIRQFRRAEILASRPQESYVLVHLLIIKLSRFVPCGAVVLVALGNVR